MVEAEVFRPAVESSARVEVQNVRRDRRVARLLVGGSLAALLGGPLALAALGLTSAAWLAALLSLVAYFASALSLAGTDRGPG